MAWKIRVRKFYKQLLIFFLAVFSFAPALHSQDEDTVKKMQEIYFYADKFFKEGKYEKSIEEFQNILRLSPGHGESMRMIEKNREKLALTEDEFEKALEEYNRGSLSGALEHLEKAIEKDPASFRVKSLMAKILTEMGMEDSFVGNNEEALKYLERAQHFSPDDDTIRDLINVSRSMKEQEEKPAPPGEKETGEQKPGKMDNMTELFEKYQKKQNEIMSDYVKTQEKLSGLIESTEREREKLYRIIADRETGDFSLVSLLERYRLPLIIFGAVIILASMARMRGRYRLQKRIEAHKQEFQKNIMESFNSMVASEGKGRLSDFDRKNKKLDIIKKELAGDNRKENEVALRILKPYLEDVDYRIRLKAVDVINSIDTGYAVKLLFRIIKQEQGDIRLAALKQLGAIRSAVSVDLLIKLVDVKNNDVKREALAALSRLIQSEGLERELKARIKKKMDDIYSKGDWIVA